MIKDLLHKEIQSFIIENESASVEHLLLSARFPPGCPAATIAEQIAGRQIAKDKLPLWYGAPNIVYPKQLSLEQCSSEKTAVFKASLIKGARFVDLTGGFGVDTTMVAQNFKEAIYVESQPELCVIAQHNFKQLGRTNIQVHNTSAEDFLSGNDTAFDFVFIDPARRDQFNRKMHSFKDCTPDMLELKSTLLQRSDTILIKASPMLDIKKSIEELESVKKIWVVAVKNECKEVLFMLGKNGSDQPLDVHCINLKQDTEEFTFNYKHETELPNTLGKLNTYLYEPNASILKAGAFKSVGAAHNLLKLHANTHLYTSGKLVHKFPGRIFKIEGINPANSKTIKKKYSGTQANILVRNFPLKPDTLFKKWKIKPGGENYLMATTLVDNSKCVLELSRIK